MSEREVRQLYDEAVSYHREIIAKQWTVADSGAANLSFESDSAQRPADLFSTADRPLVVGLFGGTGVGKSSLLNRLAAADIARTGVVRPTSMEITVYLHKSVEIAALPTDFPRECFSENRHARDEFARVMWVDMPDFDSDETQNREQVKKWLPHIDLLLYVVSPERYRDQQGWQLLQQHGYRHAWLFVMNHWDRAEPVQKEDFNKLLVRAGFEAPKIYTTVCSGEHHTEDEFDQLATFVASLSERKYIAQLDERGWLNRLHDLRTTLGSHLTLLREAGSEASLIQSFEDDIDSLATASLANLELPFRNFSQQFAEKKISPVSNIYKSLKGDSGATVSDSGAKLLSSGSKVSQLWDSWSSTRLDDTLQGFERAVDRHGYPASRLQTLTQSLNGSTVDLIRENLQQYLHEALLRPGPKWQRVAAVVARYLQWLLPICVLCWVVYRAFYGFIDGASDRTAYVGMDFLINGLILAMISWLVPWLATLLLKPSLPGAVNKALQQGVSDALEKTRESGIAQLRTVAKERDQLLKQGLPLQKKIAQLCKRSSILEDPELNNLLLSRQYRDEQG